MFLLVCLFTNVLISKTTNFKDPTEKGLSVSDKLSRAAALRVAWEESTQPKSSSTQGNSSSPSSSSPSSSDSDSDSSLDNTLNDAKPWPRQVGPIEEFMHQAREIVPELEESYGVNTLKEALALEYVDNFRVQFESLYPSRRPLMLVPQNELGVPKFVCTTVRPSQLPYKDLYEADKAASFVSDFVRYELLEDPTVPPEVLPSPTTVLKWRVGDCFDMATLLVSMLTGVGYDAYVVCGYASRRVTNRDQSGLECPALKVSAVEVKAVAPEVRPYTIRPVRPVLKSKYLEQMDARKLAAAQSRASLGSAASKVNGDGPLKPSVEGSEGGAQKSADSHDEKKDRESGAQRVHAWVLVRAGKREVGRDFFVEPSTGDFFQADDGGYLGVEAVWNHRNYWVNMQQPSSVPSIKFVDFDLEDSSKWEYMFIESRARVSENENHAEELRGDGNDGSRSSGTGTSMGESREGGGEGDGRVGSSSGVSGKSGEVGGGSNDEGSIPNGEHVLDMPASWVRKLSLNKVEFESRCPGGVRTTIYAGARHDRYPVYARSDGLVSRLTVYEPGSDNEAVKEVREVFECRHDKLIERIKDIPGDRIVERFAPGRVSALAEISFDGKEHSRTLSFHPNAHTDGLLRRTEMMGRKITEVFANRGDRLVYRSVTFVRTSEAQNWSPAEEGGSTLDEPICKMTQKFERNPDRGADEDPAKVTFYVAEDRIRVQFHRLPNRITASSRQYTKDGKSSVIAVDPYAAPPKKQDLVDEYQNLLIAEKALAVSIRKAEADTTKILESRVAEEKDISLDVSVYDTARNAALMSVKAAEAKKLGDGGASGATRSWDYLTPFLPAGWHPGDRPLLREEAVAAHDACLRALKDRLIEKANMIQARLDEETQGLARKQQAYQRTQDQLDRKEEEEYRVYCNEAMFRIHILEQRLSRHEEQALTKFAEMDQKLRADPRLEALS